MKKSTIVFLVIYLVASGLVFYFKVSLSYTFVTGYILAIGLVTAVKETLLYRKEKRLLAVREKAIDNALERGLTFIRKV